MFVGRERELGTLNELYQQGGFPMVILYGRHRIGKTTLISKFTEDKPAIFFYGARGQRQDQLEEFPKNIPFLCHSAFDRGIQKLE